MSSTKITLSHTDIVYLKVDHTLKQKKKKYILVYGIHINIFGLNSSDSPLHDPTTDDELNENKRLTSNSVKSYTTSKKKRKKQKEEKDK